MYFLGIVTDTINRQMSDGLTVLVEIMMIAEKFDFFVVFISKEPLQRDEIELLKQKFPRLYDVLSYDDYVANQLSSEDFDILVHINSEACGYAGLIRLLAGLPAHGAARHAP